MVKALGDMHIHSFHSDGKASPKEIIMYALYKGLNIVSITDHNTFAGSIEAKKYVKQFEESLTLVLGNEVRTDYGDVLVYCHEPVDAPYRLDLLIDYAHENNCLVVPAHPFDKLRLGIGEAIFEFNGWDAVEVWNASSDPGSNREALRAAKLLGLPGLANSDAHIPEAIGSAYTVFELEDFSVDGVFKAIRNKKVHPHPGYPPFGVIAKRFIWSIERRIRRLYRK